MTNAPFSLVSANITSAAYRLASLCGCSAAVPRQPPAACRTRSLGCHDGRHLPQMWRVTLASERAHRGHLTRLGLARNLANQRPTRFTFLPARGQDIESIYSSQEISASIKMTNGFSRTFV